MREAGAAADAPREPGHAGGTPVARGLCAAAMLFPLAALAYRPFVSTDADVARLHEVEIELGPVGWLQQGSVRFLTAPLLVVNYGIAPATEVVAQAEALFALPSDPPTSDFRVANTGLFVKHVWREGVLQGGTGPSVATELGLLPPDLHADDGYGDSLALIVSDRWDFGTVHVNAQVGTNRMRHLDLFDGVILEGPAQWTVRPVTEWYFERAAPGLLTLSRLAGAIWRRSDHLAFDFGLRWALAGPQREREVTAGLTWSFEAGG